MIRTLAHRKLDAALRRTAAAELVAEALRQHARTAGGRYLLYGSAARGAMRHDSDIDLLIDFPPELEAAAWRLAEGVCAANDMTADIRPLGWCTDAFRARVVPDAVVLA